mmetsp:Transcript_23848/g.68598  ORF Transcript_23848/g.68598 Transcript_23848/m.68598 type:complete len:231 (-) Transcript_23848:996-1688(-)
MCCISCMLWLLSWTLSSRRPPPLLHIAQVASATTSIWTMSTSTMTMTATSGATPAPPAGSRPSPGAHRFPSTRSTRGSGGCRSRASARSHPSASPTPPTRLPAGQYTPARPPPQWATGGRPSLSCRCPSRMTPRRPQASEAPRLCRPPAPRRLSLTSGNLRQAGRPADAPPSCTAMEAAASAAIHPATHAKEAAALFIPPKTLRRPWQHSSSKRGAALHRHTSAIPWRQQ